MLYHISLRVGVILAAAIHLSSAAPQTSTSSAACNNSPSLCGRAYNNITYLGAHDSAFVSDSSNSFTISGNQFFNSTTQLDAGVRLLSAQIHMANDSATELRLCHTDCGLYDGGTLVSWLSDVKGWMDKNPNEVVTILLVNSVNANAARLNVDFSASGITRYSYNPGFNGPIAKWPTLQSMIAANTRLVTFVASLSDNTAAPYLLDEFSQIFENPFEVTSNTNFSCLPDRPSTVQGSISAAKSSGRMFLMNHFLDKQQLFGVVIPDIANSSRTNSPDPSIIGSLGNSMQQCASAYGKAPNFVLVDWFNVGPAISSVDGWNNVASPVGRLQVTSAIVSQQAASQAPLKPAASMLALAVALAVFAAQANM